MVTALHERADSAGGVTLDDELAEITGHLNAQHGRLVDATVRMLVDDQWSGDGIHSPEQYLAWKTGLSPARARELVAIARRAEELPATLEALERGELTIDQVAAIAKRAPAYIDGEIVELARMLTVTQLRRVLARYPFPTMSTESADETTATLPNDEVVDRFWCGVCDDGRWRLRAETDQLTGMVIERALEEARDALYHGGQPDVTMVDALREVADRSLDTVTSPQRRDRFRAHIHLDTDGHATDAQGWSLPDAVRRHITCDGLLTPTFVADGIPISVGRTQRAIPERTRRLVILRDQGCRVPGCTATHHLEVHHVVHWEDGGPTDTCNLIAVCPRHHRLHHQGRLGISGNADDPDGMTFTQGDGRHLAASGARPQPPGAPPSAPIGAFESPLGERVHMRWISFRKPPGYQGLIVPHAS